MQTKTFTKTKIALAVGTALMVMAGTVQAAVITPLAGATKTVLAISASATALQLYTDAGTVNSVNIAMLLNGPGVTANGGATTVNTGTIANDDVTVQFGATIIPQAQVAVAFDAAGSSTRNITATITPTGTARLRINNTNGTLEYTTDGTVATPVWAAVTMSVQAVGGNAITENGGTAITATTAATTAFASNDFILPTSSVKTYAVAAADKISGLTVDFKHPVTAPSKTTLSLNSVAIAPLTNAVDISNAVTAGISVVTYAATAGSTTSYDVALTTPTAVDWDNSGTINAADAALYVPLSFTIQV